MAHFPKQLFVRRERPIGGSDEEYFTAPASARVKFWRGDRVRLTKEAVARGVERSQRTGVVVGFGHVGHKVRVVVDGTKTPQSYHMDFWEVIEETEDRTAQR